MPDRWTEEQTQRALYLYFQMPFGRLHQHAPEIIALAKEMGRTPSSIAMKLGNFASLDPAITSTGRKGLQGASALDRQMFARFYGQWDALVAAVVQFEPWPAAESKAAETKFAEDNFALRTFEGPSEVQTLGTARRGQAFFRQAVLANYEEQCCVSGLADSRLLIASHIKPWQADIENRHNPANGFALAATLDRAFDRRLMTIDQRLTVLVARQLLDHPSEQTRSYFRQYHGERIRTPQRFEPDPKLLAWHNQAAFEEQSFGL